MRVCVPLSTVLCLMLVCGWCVAEQPKQQAPSATSGDVESLKKEFEQMKQQYEQRIRALEEQPAASLPHRATPVGTYGGIMNADISLIVDVQTLFTDDHDNDNRNNVRVKEGELALQSYLYPGVRGDFIAAFEQDYAGSHVETGVNVEEGYVSFLNLPFGFQAELGRKFMNFGTLNASHPHHWAIAEPPLILENLFGHHPWFDDGAQLSALVPNPWDLYLKTGFGITNGRDPGHAHHNGGDHESETVDWHGHVFLSRSSFDIPVNEETNCIVGYSAAWDEGGNTALHNLDATLNYRWPMTYRKLKWHNELIYADIDDRNVDTVGFFSIVQLTLDKYWETGLRYDWSEYADDDENHAWAAGPFLTYYFTHSMYLRGEYRYTNLPHGDEENAFVIQFCWGLGPHAHRLED